MNKILPNVLRGHLPSYLLLALIFFLGACNESEYEDVTIPSNEGAVELYLSTTEWVQDSISNVSIIIEEVTLSGQNINPYTFSSDALAPINLLDSGIYLGKHVLDSGMYDEVCITVKLKLLPEKYKKLDTEFSEEHSFITDERDSLIQLYSLKTTFCRLDTIEITGGRETTVLLNFDPNKSFKIDTVYNKGIVCHLPPGNPSNRKSLKVGISAVEAHLRHGDFEGPCSPDDKVFYTNKDYDLAYVFEPKFDLSIPFGVVSGAFPAARRFSQLRMFVYVEGRFDNQELITGFKKSFYEFQIDRFYKFSFDLPPGNYSFYAMETNRNGRFQNVGRSLNVGISPLKTTEIRIDEVR